MKALVTGANGLIGSNLVRALLARHYDVRGLVRPTSDRRALEGLDVELAVGDILDFDSLMDAVEGCDLVFHVAAIFSYSRHGPETLMDTAVTGTNNVLDAAQEANVRRVVLTSSSVVFGSTVAATVLTEAAAAPEADPVPYVLSKIEQEKAAFRKAGDLNLDIVAVCPTICVGPHDYGLSESNAVIINYLNDPFRATWPGGCNIVAAADVAAGHVQAAERGASRQRYILGGENLSWRQIHTMVSAMCGVPGPLMTATHTSSYLAAAFHEAVSHFTGKRPLVTRDQATMVGRHYWYDHSRAQALGYRPMPGRQALIKAVSWLVTSEHVSAALRHRMTLADDIYEDRRQEEEKGNPIHAVQDG